MYKYAFILGREFKLSLAELGHIFGFENIISHNEQIAILELQSELSSQTILSLGGTKRILRIIEEINPEEFAIKIIEEIEKNFEKNSKVSFALASFAVDFPKLESGLRIKKTLKNYQTRLANSKNENIHSAVFKREKLAKTGTEFGLLQFASDFYFTKTIACQDIDAYSRRDTNKNRDMQTGMMPPKLVQMMINFLSKNSLKNGIYDPFCGLGTTLIEALNM